MALSLIVERVGRLHITLVHAHGLLALHMVTRLGLHGRISVFAHISKSINCKNGVNQVSKVSNEISFTYEFFKK